METTVGIEPSEQQLRMLLLEALRDPHFQHFSLLAKFNKRRGFCGDGEMSPELRTLFQLHQGLLIKLLRKNMVAFHWNDGDDHAEATLIPIRPKPDERFRKISLKFPPKPTLAS